MIESKRPSVTCLNGQPRVSVLPKRVSGPLSQGYESQCYQISLGRISDLFSRWHNYIHGGPTFDPVLKMKEVSHVKHMYATSLLIQSNFSSKLMIKWLNLFENPLLIRFQTNRKFTFDPVRTNEGGSKMSFYLLHLQNWIKSWTPV